MFEITTGFLRSAFKERTVVLPERSHALGGLVVVGSCRDYGQGAVGFEVDIRRSVNLESCRDGVVCDPVV